MSLVHRLAFASALFLAGSATFAAERPWLEIRSAHFTVITNGGEGSARDVAWQFEQMRAALQKLWPWARLTAGKPVLVFAAKDEATLKTLAPWYWEQKRDLRPVSVTVEGADRHYLTLRMDAESSDDVRVNPYFNAYRAYVHIVLDSSFERDLPMWLRGGTAELLGNTRVRDKDIFVGRLIPWHIEKLQQRAILPLRTLFEAERGSPYDIEEEKSRLFDAQSWALLHYLMFGEDGANLPKLNRCITLLAEGRDQAVALGEAFGDFAGLQKGLDSYVRQKALLYNRVDIDVDVRRERFPSRPLPTAESAALRAALHVAMRRPSEAQALVQEAKAADPVLPAAYDAAGLLEDSRDDGDKARAAYAKAAELGSTSFYTWYRSAQLAFRANTDPETNARIAKSLERTVELNPEYAAGYSYLAEVKSGLGQAEAALGLARRAISLEPGGYYHRLALARVLWALPKRDEALAEAERGLALARTDRQRASAREMVEFLRKAPARTTSSGTDTAGLMTACMGGDASACVKLAPEMERACGGGDARACLALGSLYEGGSGVASDRARAATLYRQSCEGGEKSGCARLAWLQARGEGMPKDEVKAAATLGGLCDEGFLRACTQLAVLHAGKPTKKDLARAKELLQKSCDGGEQDACSLLRSMPR